MLGYWKWLYKVTKILAKWLFVRRKTAQAKQTYLLIFDWAVVLGVASIFSPPLSTIILIVGLILLIGHMTYFYLEVE